MEKQNKTKGEIENMKKQLLEKQAVIEEYTEHLKRLQAEFENYVKRVEKERKEFVNFASEKILLKLLNIKDDMERAEKETLPKGVEIIFKNLSKLLEEEKIQKINCKGKKFDPFTQEVLLQEETKEHPEDIVLEILQEGYARNGKIIRHAKVKISKSMEGEKNDKRKNNRN